MEKIFQYFLCAALLYPVCPAFSQRSDTLSSGNLREIIISAARNEQNAAETSRSTTVLSGAQLQQTVFTNVGELLARQYGVYVVGAGQTPGQLQTLFLRGAGGNQTAVLLDGIRLYEPSSPEAATDLSELSLADVERIEIVRGSHSALYGSGAVGGVVNIVTKQVGKTGFSGLVEGRAGSLGAKTFVGGGDVAVYYAHAKGFYGKLGGHHDLVNGLDATVDSSTQSARLPRDRDGFRKTDLFGKIGYRNKQWQVFTAYRSAQQRADIDDGAFRDDNNHTSAQQRQLVQYGIDHDLNTRLHLAFTGGWAMLTRDIRDDSSGIAPGVSDRAFFEGTYVGKTLTNELQGVWTPKNARFTLGLFHFRETMGAQTDFYSNGAFGPFRLETNLDSLQLGANTSGLFAQAELQGAALGRPFRRFRANASLRFAHHSAFGDVLTFNLNPSFRLGKTTLLFAAYTTGFNAPSLYQLYTPETDFTSGISRGNPELKAENSASAEVGIKQHTNKLSWSVAIFQNTIDHSIQYVYLWAADKPIDGLDFGDYRGDTYLNIGQQRVRGLEVSITWRANARFSTGANGSLVSGKLQLPSEGAAVGHSSGTQAQLYNSGRFPGKAQNVGGLVRRPHTANCFADWQVLERLALRADLRFAGARDDVFYDLGLGPFGALNAVDVKAYWLVDLSVRWQIGKGLRMSLRGENLLNTQYQEILGYTTKGRSIFAALRFSF